MFCTIGSEAGDIFSTFFQLRFMMAATRLRKTFNYPADDSDGDDTPGDLDEEGASMILEVRNRNSADSYI